MRMYGNSAIESHWSRRVIGIVLAFLVVFSTVIVAHAALERDNHVVPADAVATAEEGGDLDGSAHHGPAACHIGIGCTASVMPGSKGLQGRQFVAQRALAPNEQAWQTRYLSPAFKPPII